MNKLSLSLVAVAMLTTAATADISSKSFDGSASLFYDTNDNGGDFFNKEQGMGNVAVQLGGAANVGNCDTCVTLNYGLTGVSTMGLENTLVSTTWINQNAALEDSVWIDTLNLTFSPLDGISNTTMILGRQSLNTPMVFTETWNIAQNTYDAAVVANNDIQDTTLVGAWVGRSNIAGGSTVNSNGFGDGGFSTFLTDEGAYAFGGVTKLIPTVTAQAWYYIAPKLANVAWLQAETELSGFTLGGQFGDWDPQAVNDDGGTGFAVKLGYDLAGLGLTAAYSSVEEGGSFVNLGGATTSLYTAGWWDAGSQGTSDTTAMAFSGSYSIENVADLGAYFTTWETGDDSTNEITVTAGKDLGNLNLSLAYINTDADGADDAVNNIQVYAVYSF